MSEKAERIKDLTYFREEMKRYLLMKFNDADWHAVQDAASDIRDLESELKGLKYGE